MAFFIEFTSEASRKRSSNKGYATASRVTPGIMAGTLDERVRVETQITKQLKLELGKAIAESGFDLNEFTEEAIGFSSMVWDYFIRRQNIPFYQIVGSQQAGRFLDMPEKVHQGVSEPFVADIRPVYRSRLSRLAETYQSEEGKQLRSSIALYVQHVTNLSEGYTLWMVDEGGEIRRAPEFLSPRLRGIEEIRLISKP